MENLKIDGLATFQGGEYGVLSIDGKAKCTGNIKAETMNVDGMFKSTGSVEAVLLVCDGLARFSGNVKAKKLVIDGLLKVDGGNKIEADDIECDGLIKVDGEISADKIKIDGFIDAGEITGDSIIIKSHKRFTVPFFGSKRSKIRLIEATTIELHGVESKEVNGKDIRIDRGCKIDSVDCSGTLWISPNAQVKNVTGNYTLVQN